MSSLSRRRFFQTSAAAGLALAAAPSLRAMEPLLRAGQPRFALSMAAYSFRNSFKDSKNKQDDSVPHNLDMFGFIDYCAEHGCAGAELTSYFFPKDVTTEYLLQVRRHAFLRGVAITGTSVGNNFALPLGPERDQQIADVKKWIDNAATLGAPHIRLFAGAAPKGLDPAEARKMCLSAIEECCAYAGQHGIFLGLENHGGIVAQPEELLEIVKAVQSPWFGINLDTANFHTEDPYASLAMIAPYAVNVQVKSEIRPSGQKENVPADLPRLIKILRDANYQGWVALEYEAKEDPYKAVPAILTTLGGLLQSSAAPVAATASATSLFDGKTLTGWKPTDFGGRGEVEVKDGQIILETGNDITGISYTGEIPKMDYEVSLEAMRVTGSDFFCGLTFPVADAHVTFVVGGWGGSVVGISSINGDDASENETTKFEKLENGKWYRLRVRVAKGSLQAWLDDEQVADVQTADKRLSMRAGEIELSVPFGIANFRTKSALRNIQLRRL